jgi:hypothetical protein
MHHQVLYSADFSYHAVTFTSVPCFMKMQCHTKHYVILLSVCKTVMFIYIELSMCMP